MIYPTLCNRKYITRLGGEGRGGLLQKMKVQLKSLGKHLIMEKGTKMGTNNIKLRSNYYLANNIKIYI